MFTLKIKWVRTENQQTVDENTIFVQADSIQVGGIIKSPDEMKSWNEDDYFNYQVAIPDGRDRDYMDARLIHVIRDNKPSVWYLASMAWLLGPDGKTLERLV